MTPPALGWDNTIYTCADSSLGAYDARGTTRWRFDEGSFEVWFSSAAVDAEGTLYVGSRDSHVYAIRSDGTLKWSFATSGQVHSSPAIGAYGTIYLGSNDGHLYAIGP